LTFKKQPFQIDQKISVWKD